MADVQHDYAKWAARKAGQGAIPAGEQPESDTGEQAEAEPVPPAHECVGHAAQELGEAIEMLEKAKGQVEDPDPIQEVIDALTDQQQTLAEKAKELEEADEDEDEDDENETPEPEAI